jgi:hypothetical protein
MSPFLQLDPAGFEIGPLDLDDPDMPEAAKQLTEEIDTIAAGHQVVPATLKVGPSVHLSSQDIFINNLKYI